MSTIVDFPLHLAKPRRAVFYQELAEVVIFPGVRIERYAEVPAVARASRSVARIKSKAQAAEVDRA